MNRTPKRNILMLLLVAMLLPAENWWTLAAMTAAGAAVYGALCLGYWKITKKSFRELNR